MSSTNQGATAPTLDDLQDEIRSTLAGYLSYEPASEATDEVVEAIGLERILIRLADAEAGLPARCAETPDLFASDVARLSAQNAALKEALRFYADPSIYKPHPHGSAFDRRDLSFRARTALKEAGADE